MSSQVPLIRIFLSSPGDVAEERKIALDVIRELETSPVFDGRVALRSVAWDDLSSSTAMDARDTPQEAINRGLPTPAQCDIVIVIFWSRMGTPFTDTDGKHYESGTHWELMNALGSEKTKTYIYRRTEVPNIPADAPNRKELNAQYDAVQGFFNSDMFYENGKIKRGVTSYTNPSNFKDLIDRHLEQVIFGIIKDLEEKGRATPPQTRVAPSDTPASPPPSLQYTPPSINIPSSSAPSQPASSTSTISQPPSSPPPSQPIAQPEPKPAPKPSQNMPLIAVLLGIALVAVVVLVSPLRESIFGGPTTEETPATEVVIASLETPTNTPLPPPINTPTPTLTRTPTPTLTRTPTPTLTRTPTPTLTRTPTPTFTPIPSETPREFLTWYYDTVTENPNETWERLSDTFKNRYNCDDKPSNESTYECSTGYDFSSYRSTQLSVQDYIITFTDNDRQCEGDRYAIVTARLSYVNPSGVTRTINNGRETYIKLVKIDDEWYFYDSGSDPRTCTSSLPNE